MFIKKYIAMLKNEFKGYNGKKLSKDLLAGLTVTAVALPLALAFGIQCGATAEAGLITAIIAGLVISALSGASYQISGPTGAMSAVLIGVVSSTLGLQGVFVVSLIAGILILLCAVFKLGKYVSKIPRPVITGFTSGIALIIALGQIQNFLGLPDIAKENKHENSFLNLIEFIKAGFDLNLNAVLLALIVVVVMVVWPKKWNAIVPSSLVGIIASTLLSLIPFFGGVTVVGSIPKGIILDDRFSFSSIDFGNFFAYISPSISIAALAIIESLLCGASASKMKKEEFDANQELIAQGVGNIVIPFFGGVPATAAIARTSVAIKSGCQTRLTGIIHALGLLASMLLLGPVMAKIPLSALAGVLMVTAWRMNEWDSIKEIFSKKYYIAIAEFLITMIATIAFDLTIAIVIGIVFSIFSYLCHMKFKPVKTRIENKESYFKNEINIQGSIFFNNVSKIEKMIISSNSQKTIISLENVVYIDTSAIEMLTEAKEMLKENKKELIIHTPSDKISAVMQRTGLLDKYEPVVNEGGIMKKYDIVLFDLDGTLTDPGEGITSSVAYALNKYGIEVKDKRELYKFIGPPLYESFSTFYGFSEEKSREAIEYYREYYREKGINECKLYDGIEELLSNLKKAGYKLSLATSKPDVFAHRVLENYNIHKYFDFIGAATADEKTRSTKEQVIEYVLTSLNVTDNSKVVMIGDRCFDINGAKQFKMDSIGVTFGYGSYNELLECGATYIVDSTKEIEKILL